MKKINTSANIDFKPNITILNKSNNKFHNKHKNVDNAYKTGALNSKTCTLFKVIVLARQIGIA